MSLHLLGITRGRPARIDAGLNRSGVHWIAETDLAAAVMPAPQSALGPLVHATLLEAIHRQMDVLPIRFGVELPDKQAVRGFLRQRSAELCQSLTRLEGSGELGLRIQLAAVPQPKEVAAGPGDGRTAAASAVGYLAARRSHYEQNDCWETEARRLADHYLQSLADLAGQARRLDSRQPDILRLAFLVPRRRWEAFRQRVESLLKQTAVQTAAILGPWPPYSFV